MPPVPDPIAKRQSTRAFWLATYLYNNGIVPFSHIQRLDFIASFEHTVKSININLLIIIILIIVLIY